VSDATSGPGQVWLIRHGATEWSESGRHTGRTDIPLTPDGERAAAALRPLLDRLPAALALSSPRQRACRTAELAGITPQIDDDLQEWDYGDYEGLTTPQIREREPGWTIWSGGVPGGETAAQVAARADRVIARARAAAAAGSPVLLFAHGHLLRVLGARWLAEPPTFGQHLLLGTAAICVLGYERGTPALARWNDTSHVPPVR
jgi:broad specificity phosphatase PhoE